MSQKNKEKEMSTNDLIFFKWAKIGVMVAVVVILILTVLEFPAPVGFETRPQDNVSLFWLALFLTILVSEIATMLLIFKHPDLGAKFGMLAAGLNIFQVIADQAHLMQPEVATLGYSMLEYGVAVVSLVLGYLCWRVYRNFLQPKIS